MEGAKDLQSEKKKDLQSERLLVKIQLSNLLLTLGRFLNIGCSFFICKMEITSQHCHQDGED